jgi:hypothetical protein
MTIRGIAARSGRERMGMLRFDHVGVVVDDLDAVAAFFLGLGFEREGGALVEGEVVDKINGLDGVRAEVVMVRAPDGSGKLELVKYHAPAAGEGPHPSPANRLGFRYICIEVKHLNTIVEGLRDRGFGTVGEVQDRGVQLPALLRPRSRRTDRRARRAAPLRWSELAHGVGSRRLLGGAGAPTRPQQSNTDQQMPFRNRWSSRTSPRIASGSRSRCQRHSRRPALSPSPSRAPARAALIA